MTASGVAARDMAARGLSVRDMAVRGVAVRDMAVRGVSERGVAARGVSARGVAAPGVAERDMATRGSCSDAWYSRVESAVCLAEENKEHCAYTGSCCQNTISSMAPVARTPFPSWLLLPHTF